MEAEEPQFSHAQIRALMERDGLDYAAFAKRAGVSRSLIYAWAGGVATPQVGTLARLCRVFDVPITFFFTGQDGGQADD